MRLHDEPEAPQDTAEAFDAVEAGFSGAFEPALDIGPPEVTEPTDRTIGGRSGGVRERGARAFGASVLAALACDDDAAWG